jgi:hypothetical protein
MRRLLLTGVFLPSNPMRASDFAQSALEGPRMSPSMYASPGQREQLET